VTLPQIPRGEPEPFYTRVGGEPTFQKLVHRFYQGVAIDSVLRPLYPEEDLGPAEERLTLFLIQYWGGPTTYGDRRGHPRLRLRHDPFHIDALARDRWLHHMAEAVRELELDEADEAELWQYLERAAHFMVNTG
jgi:hemoglobin